MDLDVGVLVHGGEGHAVLQLVCQDPSVHHVVAKGVEQLDVDVAYQGVQHFLEGRPVWQLGPEDATFKTWVLVPLAEMLLRPP